MVREFKDQAERTHKLHRDRWDSYYDLYRGYVTLKRRYSQEGRATILDAQRDWGARLHIPYVFATVETIVPRALSNDPAMRALPFSPDARESAQAVAKVFERDQKKIGYEQKLQETARNGFIYGLGVQKCYWQKKARKIRTTEPRRILPGYQMVEREQILFEGPQCESVDIRDFFWDMSAKDMDTCHCVLHRTWRTFDYVTQQIKTGAWMPVDLDAVRRTMDESAWSEAWKSRKVAAGTHAQNASGPMCQVWEYHTRNRVITILNETFVVQDGENPAYHGELPFQIFRPTLVPGEFVGIGEIEMIQTLQHELDTMRSQRRDSATIKLNPPLFVQEGFVDGDIKLGPGVVNPVIGAPRESVYQLDMGDLPSSSYSEEGALKADIERVSGIDDALMSGGGEAAETATGMQLAINNATVRIKLKSKNFINSVVYNDANQRLALYKQHKLEPEQVRISDTDSQDGYAFVVVSPEDFQAIEEMIPVEGSTEPDDPAAREEKALRLFNQLNGNPAVDQRVLIAHHLKENNVANADKFLVPPGPDAATAVEQTVRTIGMSLEEMGMPEELIEAAIQAAAGATEPIGPAPEETQEEGEAPSV